LGGNYTERVIQDFDSVKLEKVVLQSYKIFLLSIPAFDIASEDIRRKVKMRESIADLVAERVEKYISSNKLYQ
jgi:nicotinic acid mononucleotide adenylyltransferase